MPQIFQRSTNTISKVSIFGAVFAVAALLGLFDKINRSPWMTDARVAREQRNTSCDAIRFGVRGPAASCSWRPGARGACSFAGGAPLGPRGRLSS